MRKNWKRFLALACAAAMVIPSTAPISAMADLGDSYVGDSAIENDNSILPNITNVVLSTITDTTYNFRVDPDQLLNEFNSGLYTSGSMYFENEATPVDFTLPTDYSFYIKSMGLLPESSATADLKADSRTKFLSTITVNTTKSADFIAALDATEYYVWQPNDDMIGLGSYVRITADNYMNFIELTVNDTDVITEAVMDATPNLSEGDIYAIWDGGIYVPTYTKVDGSGDNTVAKKIVPLFDVEYGVFDESVYVGLSTIGNPAVYYNTFNVATDIEAAVNTTDAYVDITLTEATSNYQNISRAASITNKSTFDIAVTASIQMTGGEGLTLSDTATFAQTSGANVYLAVADLADTTNNVVPVEAPSVATTIFDEYGNEIAVTGEASAYYVLKGTGTDNVIYTMGEIEEATQSNIYYRYLNPTTTANKASFAITGKSDTRAYDGTITSSDPDTEAALLAGWEGYIQDLANGIATRPQINIVYTFDKVTSTDNKTFTNLDLDTFAKADSSEITTTGWVEFTATSQNAGLDKPTYTYTYGDEIDVTYYPADAELLSVMIDTNETDEYTITDNVITLSALNSWLVEKAEATDTNTTATVTLKVTFANPTDEATDDGDPAGVDEYTATITVNGTKPVANP